MVTNYVNISDIDSSVVDKPKKQKKTSTTKK